MSLREKYQEVMGLEVHIQLATKTKAYSADTNEYGSLPNTNVSVITLAHPGTLPRSNKTVIEYAMKLGLACKSEITRFNRYDRKNYFYPDLPKGYQLTQDQTPICVGGYIPITTKSGLKKNIEITRIHMEEDSGKSMHLEGEEDTLVDLNRAGVPLLEIVTEPCVYSAEEAAAFLGEVRKLVRYLEVCDGNMEEGSMRCDANISVRLKTTEELGKRVEVKNMNSISNVQRAIEYEIERQIVEVEAGNSIVTETRLFDSVKGETRSMRKKEELNDYRYFPEPDLQPVVISDEWLNKIKAGMPSLPNELYARFTQEYGLTEYDALVLTDQKGIALYFEELCTKTTKHKEAANWVINSVKSYLNDLALDISLFPLGTDRIAELIEIIEQGKISKSSANQNLFPAMIQQPTKHPLEIAQEMNLVQDSDEDSLLTLIKEVIAENENEVARYKNGETKLLAMFMGKVMKKSRGKADPKKTTALLNQELNA